MAKNTHGGPGRGQGRKRKFEELERRTVTLTPAHAARLEQLGNGNLSLGIRKAIEMTTAPRHLTDNAHVARVGQLRQMVADLPDAPATSEDVEYYITDYWQDAELDAADVRFVRAEIERQYGVASE
jgi:hypothetical protein